MKMKDLIGEVVHGKGRSLAERLPAATRKKIRSDFCEILKAEKAGNPIPSMSDIARFFKSEYNVKMSRGTATRWLEQVREELNGKDK